MSEDESGPPRNQDDETAEETVRAEHDEVDSATSPEEEAPAEQDESIESDASGSLEEDDDSKDEVEEGGAAEQLVTPTPRIEVIEDEEADRLLRRLTRRGFLSMAAAGGAGYVGWKWLQTRSHIDRRPWPFRRTLDLNEKLAQAYYDPSRLSPTFSSDRIDKLRANGRKGLTPDLDPASWRLRLEGVDNATSPIELTLDEVRQLPSHEMITELRCIEGWSIVVKWTGARLIDLMKRFPPPTRDGSASDPVNHPERLVRYVAIETPGKGYYVGLDMPSAIHPQTLLVWSMNDQLLNWKHGAPLRLAIPVKYGIKNIKRIGTIRYTDVRPPDYWAKRGYDWYAGF